MRKPALGIVTAVCILILAIATPLSFGLLSRIADSFIDSLVYSVSEKLELTLKAGKISPRLLGSVRVDAVSLSRNDGSTLLSIKSVVVHYSLVSILLGRNEGILRSITIDSPVLDLDEKSDSDLPVRISRFFGDTKSSSLPVFSVVIRNLNADIKGDQFKVFIESGLLRFRGNGEFETASISDTTYKITGSSLPATQGQLSAAIKLGNTLEEVSGSVHTSISSGSTLFFPLDLMFSTTKTGVTVNGKLGEGATFRGDRTKTDGKFLISFLFDRFIPARMSGPLDLPVPVQELLALPLSGKASVALEKDFGIRSLTIDVASQNASAGLQENNSGKTASGQPEFIFQASGTQKLIQIPRLSVMNSGYSGSFIGNASLENASVSGQLALVYKGVSATFSVSGKDGVYRATSPSVETPDVSYENAEAILDFGKIRQLFSFTAGKSSASGRELYLSGSLDESGSGHFNADLDVHNFRTDSLRFLSGSILPPQISELIRGGRLSGSLNVKTLQEGFSWRSPGLVYENAAFRIEASGVGDEVQSDIRGIRFFTGNVSVDGNAMLHTGKPGKGESTRLVLDLVSRGKPYKLEATLSPEGTVKVTGDYGLSVFSPAPNLSEGSSSRFIQFTATDFPLPVPVMTSTPLVSFNGEAFVDEAGVSFQPSRASVRLTERNLPSSLQLGFTGLIPFVRKSADTDSISQTDLSAHMSMEIDPESTALQASRSLNVSFIELIWADKVLTGAGRVSIDDIAKESLSISMKLESSLQKNQTISELSVHAKSTSEERWELDWGSSRHSSRLTAHVIGFPLNRIFNGLNGEELSAYLSLSGSSLQQVSRVGIFAEFPEKDSLPARVGELGRVFPLTNNASGNDSAASPSPELNEARGSDIVDGTSSSNSSFFMSGSLMAGVTGPVISIPEKRFDVSFNGSLIELALKENPVTKIRASYEISNSLLVLDTRFDHMPAASLVVVHNKRMNIDWSNLLLDGQLQAQIPILRPETSIFSTSLKAYPLVSSGIFTGRAGSDASLSLKALADSSGTSNVSVSQATKEFEISDTALSSLSLAESKHFPDLELGIELSGSDGILNIKQFHINADTDHIKVSGKIGIPASTVQLSGSVRLGTISDSDEKSKPILDVFPSVPLPLATDFSVTGERGIYLLEIPKVKYGLLDLSNTRIALQFTQGLRSDFKGLAATLKGSLNWQGLNYPITADLDTTGRLQLESGENFSVVLKPNREKWLVSANLDGLPVALGEGQNQVLLNGSISGEYGLSGSPWLIKSESLSIRSAGGKESSIPDIDLTFAASPGLLQLTNLRIRTGWNRELSGTASLTNSNGNSTNVNLTLKSGKESLVIVGKLVDRHISGNVTAIEMDSRYLNPNATPGKIDGFLEFKGPVDKIISSYAAWKEGKEQPQNDTARLSGNLSIGFHSQTIRIPEQRVEFSIDGNSVKVQQKSIHGIDLMGTCNLASGTLSVRAGLEKFRPVQFLMSNNPVDDEFPEENPNIIKALESIHLSGSLEISGTLRHLETLRWKAKLLGKGSVGKNAQPVLAALDLDATNLKANISKLSVSSSTVGLDYSGKFDFGSFEAQGILNINAGLNRPQPVKSRMMVSGKTGTYELTSDGLLAGGLVYRNPAFRLQTSKEEYKVTGSIGIADSETGYMSILAHIIPWEENPSIESEIGFTSFRSEVISSLLASLFMIDIENFTSQAKLDGSLFVMSDFSSLAWNTASMLITGKDYSLRCSGSGNDSYAELSDARFRNSSIELSGTGRILYKDSTKNDAAGISLKLRSGTLEYVIEGTLDKDGRITATGNHGIMIDAVPKEAGYQITIAASDLPVPLPQANTIISIAFSLTASIGRTSFSIDSGACVVKDSGGKESVLPQVSFRIENSKDGIDILDCVLQWRDRILVGTGSLGWSKGIMEFSLGLEDTVSSGGSGAERWSLNASSGPEGLYFDAQLLGLPVSSVLSVLLSPEQIQVSQNFTGSIDLIVRPRKDRSESEPDGTIPGNQFAVLNKSSLIAAQVSRSQILPFEFSFRLTNGEYLSTPLALDFSGAFSDKIFEIKELDLQYLGHQINGASFSIDIGTLASTAFVPYIGVLGSSRIRLGLECAGGFIESATLQEGNPDSETEYRLEAQIVAGTIGKTDVLGRRYWLTLGASGIRIESSTSEVAGNIASDGSMDLVFAGDFPVHGQLKGTLDTSLNLEVSEFDADIPWLSSTFLPGVLVFPAGRATGSFTISGNPDDPSIRGDVTLRSVVLTLPDYLEESIGPFDVPLKLEGETFSFLASNVQIGAGAAEITTALTLDHWMLTALTVDVKTIGDATVGISGKIVGIEIEGGKASIDVKIALDADILRISGRMELERGEVTVNPSAFMAQNTAPPPQGLKIYLDSSFGFGRKVRVYLPSRDLPVIMGNADPSSTLELELDTETGEYRLDGLVTLRGGYAIYYLRNFFLRSGQIKFSESISGFDPRISFLAENREANISGPVTVSLTADNQRLSQLSPTLSSDPPLRESEIVALLGGGVLPAESGEVGLREAFVGSSEFIPQLDFAKAFEQRVRDALGLDVLYVRSSFLQRWIYTISDPDAGEAKSLGSYLDNTYLYAGKYFGKAAFIHAALRLREDPLVAPTALRLDSELGLEFETPIGFLRWTVSPRHLDSLFIRDQSISLSWKIPF